jgi:hypothetical protein
MRDGLHPARQVLQLGLGGPGDLAPRDRRFGKRLLALFSLAADALGPDPGPHLPCRAQPRRTGKVTLTLPYPYHFMPPAIDFALAAVLHRQCLRVPRL